MRWPRRRKSRSAPTGHHVVGIASPPARRPVEHAWRHVPALAPLITRADLRVADPLGFGHGVAGSQSLTTRVAAPAAHDPHLAGLVHLHARPQVPLVVPTELVLPDTGTYELPLPPRIKPRPVPVVAAPAPGMDLVHATLPAVEIDDDFGDDDLGFGSDGPGPPFEPPPVPPTPPAPPEATIESPPERTTRIFRPRRLGLGDPLPPGQRPGDRPESTPETRDEPDVAPSGPSARQEAFNEAIDAAIREESERRARSEPVPDDLRATLSTAFGTAVGTRPLHRGPDVTRRAQQIGARAFTEHEEVYVSDDVGPLAQTEARATIAHELTHVAQQWTLGTALPDEHTVAGRRLEAAARSVEDYVRGTPDAPRPTPDLLHPDRVPRGSSGVLAPEDYARQVADELVARGLAHRDGAGDLVAGPQPPATSSDAGVQRQPTATATPAAQHVDHGFFDNLGRELQGMVLDEWSLSADDQRRIEMEQEIDARADHYLRGQNAFIDEDNAHLAAGTEPRPHLTEISNTTRAQIREQVEHEYAAQDRQRADRLGAHGGAGGAAAHGGPGGAAAATGGTAAGTHPGGGTGTGAAAGTGAGGGTATGAHGTGQAQGIHSFGDIGRQMSRDYADLTLGMWGLDLATVERQDQGHGTGGAGGPQAATAAAPAAGHDAHHDAAAAGHTAAVAGAAAAAHHGASGTQTFADTHSFAHLEDHEVEELVRRVYARLRTELRNELLVDRERAGMLADFR